MLSVYINNHTSVWGSWYDTTSSTWGYACCHSTVHISYCTGEAGKQAAAASSAQNLLTGSSRPEDSTPRSPETGRDKGKQRKTDIDVETEQSKLSDERKRKARANEGDDRFSKRSKDEEAVESKKFDVSEDELGTEFIQAHVDIEKTDEWIQSDSVVRGVGWKTQWPTMWIAEILYDNCSVCSIT
jgi:pre-mRNA-processing factor SLU7